MPPLLDEGQGRDRLGQDSRLWSLACSAARVLCVADSQLKNSLTNAAGFIGCVLTYNMQLPCKHMAITKIIKKAVSHIGTVIDLDRTFFRGRTIAWHQPSRPSLIACLSTTMAPHAWAGGRAPRQRHPQRLACPSAFPRCRSSSRRARARREAFGRASCVHVCAGSPRSLVCM